MCQTEDSSPRLLTMLSSRLAAPLRIEAGTGDGEGDARGERRCFNCEVVDAMGEWKWIGQEERV